YAYVIVNTTTGNITGISASANLTNSTTYAGGTYAVYGLSYSNTITTLNTYVGGSLTALITNIFANPGSFCANFSKNLVTVIITSPVPTSFLGLTARKEGSKALLNWKTASEQNSDHFNVQRSADGINFTNNIGRTSAAGSSTVEKNYNFTDYAPVPNLNYFRVEEVDIDGTTTISNTVVLSFGKNGLMQIYPNPANDMLNVDYNSNVSGVLTLHVIDSKGALVGMRNISVTAGRSLNSLNVSKLANGIYLLRYIEPTGQSSSIKFIKK
ncbi:MAG: T9SS type A sorting domain-containing protein, partial [Ferruginibacter sp.]|nr:T9SS type A sorting domain-containing protein [Ferruginibacter sp.]